MHANSYGDAAARCCDNPAPGGWLILITKEPFFRSSVIRPPTTCVSHVANVVRQSIQAVGSKLNLQPCIISEPDAYE
jgi:hypothetical protein